MMTKKIIAAGGVVVNEEEQTLFIFRRGKWDLPKGKLDKGETIEECAVREIEEETGLSNVQLGKLIIVTHHHYTEDEREIDKETHWFNMSVTGTQELVPQLDEGISDLRWVGKNELADYLLNTYDTIREVISKQVG